MPYLPLRVRFWITVAVSLGWASTSLWIALPWIGDLAAMVTLPVAVLVVLGVAVLPGYVNAHLLSSSLLDSPTHLRIHRLLPPITVLVAAFNEEEAIEDCVRFALGSRYPGHLRVIVVDDGSADGTSLKVHEMLGDPRLRLIRIPNGGKANALNAALAQVTTPLVATLDADTLLLPQSLARAVARLDQSPDDTVAVAGGVLVRNSRAGLVARMQEWDYFVGIASVKREQGLMRGTLVAQGAFSVYTAAALRQAGGWPDMIGEDIVLTWAMLEAGGRTTHEPTAIAFTDVPVTLRAFARQRQRWARGMIEGLRAFGWRLLRRRRMYAHAVAVNWVFPLLDFAVTFAVIPGIVLAGFGNYAVVGLMTLAVLPLNGLITLTLFVQERRRFKELRLSVRRNWRGLLLYLFAYQLIMSPVSVAGYLKELVRARRRW